MATNIEKLAEQLNALTDYDPMALECTEATISKVPGERRIYLQSFMEGAVFHIDFDQVLPYDPDGAAGTTSDVFAGARISLSMIPSDDSSMSEAEAKKFADGYLKMVRFSLSDAAKEGRISSKTLAETKFTAASSATARPATMRKPLKEAKESQEEFLNSLDPVTSRKAILETG